MDATCPDLMSFVIVQMFSLLPTPADVWDGAENREKKIGLLTEKQIHDGKPQKTPRKYLRCAVKAQVKTT